MIGDKLRNRLESAFTPPQIEALTDLFEAHMRSLVKASDFNELKEIVRDLGEAQRRTEVRVEELAGTMREMAKTQNAMQQSMDTMLQTQAAMQRSMDAMLQTQTEMLKTQDAMRHSQDAMQVSIAQLSRGLDDVRSLAGSNAQTLGYMLENEAYRNLPAWLKEHHGIEVLGRMIRQEIADEEINLLVEARQGAEDILIVGEAKSRLHLSDLGLMAGKVEAVQEQYAGLRGRRILPLLVAHYAPDKIRQRAMQDGMIVVQSFEW